MQKENICSFVGNILNRYIMIKKIAGNNCKAELTDKMHSICFWKGVSANGFGWMFSHLAIYGVYVILHKNKISLKCDLISKI